MYELGDTVGDIGGLVKDADGVATNATTVTLTIYLPDGTTATPVVTNPPAVTGTYVYDYVPTVAGLYGWHLSTTGPVTATSGNFYVTPAAPTGLVSLTDAKRKCNVRLTDTSLDDDIRGWIAAATRAVENHLCRAIARRTVTQTIRTGWSRSLILTWTPVMSVTSIASIDGSSTWDVANLHVDTNTGIVTAKAGPMFAGDLTVTYVAGMGVVPDNYIKATLIIIEHLFGTERPLQRADAGASMYEDSMDGSMAAAGFAIPNRALELLGKPPPMVG